MFNSQVVASVLLIAGALLLAQWQRQPPSPQAKFEEIRPGLHRLNYVFNLHVVAPAHIAVWLIESTPNSWILVDAGTPSPKNQRAILQGLQATLSSAEDTLRLVLGQTLFCATAIPFCKLVQLLQHSKCVLQTGVTIRITHHHDMSGCLIWLQSHMLTLTTLGHSVKSWTPTPMSKLLVMNWRRCSCLEAKAMQTFQETTYSSMY